ncbi:hypothetical protein CR513_59308, partial [Mucuna pruriens]
MQNLHFLDCDDYTKGKLIGLSYEDYALIWWIVISLQCRGLRKTSNLFVKLQKIYQGPRSIDGYFKEMKGIVELYDYTSISMLVHQTFKVESQLKRHGKKILPYH